MSSHTILPLHAVPALPCYVLSWGTHLSHSTPLFCGTAIGSAMRSMSSRGNASTIASCSRTIRSLSRYLLSCTTPPPTSRYTPLAIAPLAYAHDVLSHDTASICGTRYPMLCPPSGYPPLSQQTPLLWYRHWLCYAQYVLSRGNVSTISSCSHTVHSLAISPLVSYPPPLHGTPLSQ